MTLLRPMYWVMTVSIAARILNFLAGTALLAVGVSAVVRFALGEPLSSAIVVMTLVALALFKGVVRYVEQYTGHYVAFHLLAQLRYQFYNALEPQTPAGLQRLRSGDAVSRVIADIDRIEPFYAHTIAPFFAAVIAPLTLLAALGYYNIVLALGLLPFLVLVGVVAPWIAYRASRAPAARTRREAGEISALLTDSFQGIRDVLAFNYGERRRALLREAGERLRSAQAGLARTGALQNGVIEALLAGGTLTLLALSIWLVQRGMLAISDVPVIVTLGWMAFQPLLGVTGVINDFNGAMASAERLFELMDQAPAVQDPAQPRPFPVNQPLHLRFENVSFRYPQASGEGNAQHVLHNITFDIPFGRTIAIVGRSGAGKSTLLALLLRFWDPTDGRITLNGVDIREFSLTALRHHIAVVSQNAHVFNASIRENIRLGKPSASDDEIIAAARAAHLHDFVMTLPHGYDTPVGELGNRFSGGQRQRLALARAFLKDAPILVLDEATANLDPETERAVQDALHTTRKERTTIIITHQLSTVRMADEILVLDNGRLVECGTHDALLRRNGTYAQLFAQQRDLWEDIRREEMAT
ncbi:MAG: thiol reductant ABC exporter subunit CydC [Roseiflexaceae bacterium]|nr:thiol reductant ABC exporter subunit CydC [Roseiflexaceae bacterium]